MTRKATTFRLDPEVQAALSVLSEEHRQPLSSATINAWQALIMRGLEPTEGEPIGAYRGEAGTGDTVTAVIILCAWAHGEWLRIHPIGHAWTRVAGA